jgi:drug/metabolite transporter (DMT)-like permease
MKFTYNQLLILCLSSVYIIWGSTFLAVKLGIDGISPIFLSSIRFIIGGVIMLVLALVFEKPKLNLIQIKNSLKIGILLIGFGNTALAIALKTMSTGIVAIITGAIPLFVIVLDFFFFTKKKPNIISQIGIIIGIIGLFILINPFQKGYHADIKALIIMFTGILGWAWGTLLSPKLEMPTTFTKTALQMLFGGLFSLIISLFVESNHVEMIVNINQKSVLAIAYLIFIGSFLGYSAFVWLVSNTSAEIASTNSLVNPVVAMFLGSIFLDEKITFSAILATILVIVSLFLMIFSKKITERIKLKI